MRAYWPSKCLFHDHQCIKSVGPRSFPFLKTRVRAILCSTLLAVAVAATPAFANTIDNFTITDNSSGSTNIYTFSLPSSPTLNLSSTGTYFDITGVPVSVNGGTPATGTTYFLELSATGGVGIAISSPSTFLFDEGPQLFTFTGTLGQANFAPTFTPGTYALIAQNDPHNTALDGSITISAANAPEPGSFALLGTGALGLFGVVRRKLIPVRT